MDPQRNGGKPQLELYDSERALLREELHNLKKCQITFLTTSITATGAILGFVSTSDSIRSLGVIALLPLAILLPSWWIFFDKATTITRIVGYYRVLEKLIFQGYTTSKFLGWENALRVFRAAQTTQYSGSPDNQERACGPSSQEEKRSLPRKIIRIFLLRTTHKYWAIIYHVFFGLSVSCVILGAVTADFSLAVVFFFLVSILLLILSAWWNAHVVWHLVEGKYSYDSNEDLFHRLLDIRSQVHNTLGTERRERPKSRGLST